MVQFFDFDDEDMDDYLAPEDNEQYEEVTITLPSDIVRKIEQIDTKYGIDVVYASLLIAGMNHLDETIMSLR